MKFMVQFGYKSSEKENLLRQLDVGGLEQHGLSVAGAWIAVQTGLGFVLVDTDDALKLYEVCSKWSDYGALTIYPVIDASEIP